MLDLRTLRVLQTMENPRHYGPITCICLDRKRAWVIVGTSTGVLSLWDIRFGILIRSWKAGIASKGKSTRVHQCVVHPSKGKGKWIIVALETTKIHSEHEIHTLLEVWDIEKATLVETFITRVADNPQEGEEPQEVPSEQAEMSPAAAIAALVRSRQENGGSIDSAVRRPRPGPQGTLREDLSTQMCTDTRAIIVGSEFGGHSAIHRSTMGDQSGIKPSGRSSRGFILSGSEDRKIRFWDLGKIDRSAILSGTENESERPVYRFVSFSCLLDVWSQSDLTMQQRTLVQRDRICLR